MMLRRELLTAEMIDPGTGELVRTTVDVRRDPLTGHSSRILPERGLMPASDFDLEAFARENQPSCPFCPERIDRCIVDHKVLLDRSRVLREEPTDDPRLQALRDEQISQAAPQRVVVRSGHGERG